MAGKGSSDVSGAVWEAVLAVTNRMPIWEFRKPETLAEIRAAILKAEPNAFNIEVGFGAAMPVYAHFHLPGDPWQKLLRLFENDFQDGVFGAGF